MILFKSAYQLSTKIKIKNETKITLKLFINIFSKKRNKKRLGHCYFMPLV